VRTSTLPFCVKAPTRGIWRKHNPGVRPSLSGAFLVKADLSAFVLVRANLIMANLSRADLCGTDRGGANLSEAKLRERNSLVPGSTGQI
jgi:hypothetical protein